MVRILSGAIRLGRAIGSFAAAKVWALASPSFALMNTTNSQAGTADQFSWTQGLPYFQDINGNDIAPTQFTGANNSGFSYRNNGGSWADATVSEGALTHRACAYDAANGLIHALCYSTGLGDANGNIGYVYRRYVIQYSGNTITNIVSDNGITIGGSSTRTNVTMDAQGVSVPASQGELPSLLLIPNGTYGTLVALMPMQNTNGAELRISMCAMGASSSAAKVVGGWVNPLGGATATTSIGGSAPYVAYGKVLVVVAGSQIPPTSALYRKQSGTNAGDLCVVYSTNQGGNSRYMWVRLKYNAGSSDWSNGLSTPVSLANIQRAGADTGYTLKYQLLTNIVEDASGNAYIGMATWRDNANGDTWGYAQVLDSAETVTLVDVYSAAGVHSYAPTGHIAYDPSKGLLVVSYIKTTTQFAFAQVFAGTTQKIGELAVFSTAKVDIPYFLTGNPTVNATVPMILRDTTASPFHGYSGTLTWQ